MKNTKLLAVLIVAMLLCVALVACTSSYTVTFESNGGTPVQSQSVRPNNYAEKPQDPTRMGYAFAGWFYDASLTVAFEIESNGINENTTLYAKWTPNVYKISYDFQGGTGSVAYTNVNYSEAYTLIIPTLEHHTFIGWYGEANGQGTKYTGANGVSIANWNRLSDVTLYAYFAIDTNVITLDYNGGAILGAETEVVVVSGEDYVLPVPSFEYRDFLGWFDEDGNAFTDENGESLEAWNGGNDITLYANWLRVTFVITLDVNGGDALDEIVFLVDLDEDYTLPVPTYEGFSFGGWCDVDDNPYTDNNGIAIEAWSGDEDIILYALWNEILPTEGLVYAYMSGSNSYVVSKGTATNVEHIIIRETYDDSIHGELPVTSILQNGFTDSKNLRSIKIPETVTIINANAFSGCDLLEDVNFPESLITIGGSAFYRCYALKTVILGNKVTAVNTDAFGFCSALETVIIYGNGATLYERAFDNTGTINTVVLDKVNTVSMRCFTSCIVDMLIILKASSQGMISFGGMRAVEAVNHIYLPDQATLDAYSTASGWSSFASVMEINPNPGVYAVLPILRKD